MRLNDFLTSDLPICVGITGRNLYFVWMTRGKIITLLMGLFYFLLIMIMIAIDPVSPIGPCGPSSGMMIFLSIPFLAAAGLLVSLIGLAGGHRSVKGPAIVNGAVLLIFFLFLSCMGWLH
jgi:hypothetical protein